MGSIVVLGVFVADTSYRAARMPKMGETILGDSFVLGPGGKVLTKRLPLVSLAQMSLLSAALGMMISAKWPCKPGKMQM